MGGQVGVGGDQTTVENEHFSKRICQNIVIAVIYLQFFFLCSASALAPALFS